MTWRNLMRACGENRLPVAVLLRGLTFGLLCFLAGFFIGQMRGYYYGAADQRHQDALLTPEGREHLSRELQKAATNPPAVLIPK